MQRQGLSHEGSGTHNAKAVSNQVAILGELRLEVGLLAVHLRIDRRVSKANGQQQMTTPNGNACAGLSKKRRGAKRNGS